MDRPERHGPPPPTSIDRREAIRRVAALLGGVGVVGGSGLLAACERRDDPSLLVGKGYGSFTAGDVAFLDEVADTILPQTSTPGAKAAAVGAFMAVMVTDSYDADQQALFRDGMTALDDACRTAHGVGFVDADPAQRLALLERMDREQFDREQARASGGEAADAPVHWFRRMKQLTLLGYFTSEIGCTQAQRYLESPGRFDPCVPHMPGERSWAGHA